MKYSITIPLLLLFLFGGACKEESRVIPDIYWGEITALKNGVPWQGEIRANLNKLEGDGFNISVGVYNENAIKIEFLSIVKIPLQQGYNIVDTLLFPEDTVIRSTSASYGLSHGDAQLAFYYVLEEDGFVNYINVTSYNETTREVKGEFEIAYLETRAESIPDTVRFTNGKFYTRINEKDK